MFVFDRSALAVLVPLALLVAVVLWSNRATNQPPTAAARRPPADRATTVAQADSQRTGQLIRPSRPTCLRDASTARRWSGSRTAR